jgi:RNA polymerase sigma-70 factor (ECF subfamily)
MAGQGVSITTAGCWSLVIVVQMIEDRLLIWRFNRGEPAALCRIYEKYRDGLLKVAAALLNNRNEVEDVLHDVFVDFAQSVGQFELNGSLKGYLAICVANRARDKNRLMQRRSAARLDETTPLPTDPQGPEHAAMSRELVAKLGTVMSELPDDQREVVVLHLQSKLPFREIAKLKQVSINTAMSRYRYGLDKLRASLDGKLDHD